jgi:hypothetical protein
MSAPRGVVLPVNLWQQRYHSPPRGPTREERLLQADRAVTRPSTQEATLHSRQAKRKAQEAKEAAKEAKEEGKVEEDQIQVVLQAAEVIQEMLL